MRLHAADVALEGVLALLRIVGRDVVRVGGEADFAVDDDGFSVGVVHDHVGAHDVVGRTFDRLAGIVADGVLRAVVDALHEAGIAEDGLEDHFAPVALRLALALQRVCEVVRVRADLLGHPDHGFVLVLQGFVELDAVFADVVHGLLVDGELFAERGEDGAELLPVRGLEIFGALLQDGLAEDLEFLTEMLGAFLRDLLHLRLRLAHGGELRLRLAFFRLKFGGGAAFFGIEERGGFALFGFKLGRGTAFLRIKCGGGLIADGCEFSFMRLRCCVRFCLRRMPGEFEFTLRGEFELFERAFRADLVGDRLIERGGAGFEFGDACGVGARFRPHPKEQDERAEDKTDDPTDDSI